MSEHVLPGNQAFEHDETHEKKQRREMTRRQFLSYTLGGAGAFMAAGVIVPMLRFAVDPILRPKSEGTYVKVVPVDQVTEEPVSYTFKVTQQDGWVTSDTDLVAWISKDAAGNIFALSPMCKHLGCAVNWNTNAEYPNQYFCPCHGAHYTKDGKNLAVAPAPLDEYDVRISDDGYVYLGPVKPNERV